MISFRFSSFLAISALFLGCSSSTPDTLVTSGYDEEEMAKAIERAISEVDTFIADLKTGQSMSYGVKVPIEDDGAVEHFWLTGVTYDNNKFTGTIDNEPGIVSNVTIGQQYSVAKDEISDWMFLRDGKMYGNYTMRPLLATLPEEEANRYRAMFANP